jgi:ADP-heptose:LPS heptosyltransferase
MLPKSWQNIQKVLVMQLGQNLAQTVPTLQKLRQLLPDATITLIASPCIEQESFRLPWINEVFVYEGFDKKFVDVECELHLISKLRQYAFDAAIICTNPGESPYPLAYICYLAGIPIRIGHSEEFGGGVLSQWIKLTSKEPQPVLQLFSGK